MYRMLFDDAADAIFIHDLQGRILAVNTTACERYGYTRQELLGMTACDVDSPAQGRHVPARIARLMEQGSLRFESEHRHKDGRTFLVDITAKLITWNQQQAIVSIARDITARKEAEESLRKSEERFDLAMQVANDGLWDWNIAHDSLYFDPRYYTLAGYEPNEFPHAFGEWAKRLHPDDHDRCLAAVKAHLAGEAPIFDIEFRFLRKDGTWMWIRGRGKAVERDASGVVTRMLGTHSDITDRKRAEEEREKLQAQLLQSQKMESVGRLAGGVAHDFNNMLQTILGNAELALDGLQAGAPHYPELLEIRKAAERSAKLTQQLLAFARKQTILPKVLHLNQVVESMLNMLKRLIGENVELVWRPAKDLWPVLMDSSQVDQIVTNLCVNARDAIADMGRIIIATGNISLDKAFCSRHPGFLAGDYARLEISDNGKGMDREVQAHLFEPFFTSKEVGKGSGLGLSTVYGIVKQNNGFIHVYSEPGHGSVFSVYLPRHLEPENTATMEPPAEARVVSGHETILLVEDEVAVMEMAQKMLQRYGYRVLAAPTAGEAIRLAGDYAGKIHLLITDIVMPEMNGRVLAEKLSEIHPNLQCLFMSGYTADVIAHRGVVDEGLQFIQKPFSGKDLAAAARKALAQ